MLCRIEQLYLSGFYGILRRIYVYCYKWKSVSTKHYDVQIWCPITVLKCEMNSSRAVVSHLTHNKWPLAVLFPEYVCKCTCRSIMTAAAQYVTIYSFLEHTCISHTSFSMIFIVLVSLKTFVFSYRQQTPHSSEKVKRLKVLNQIRLKPP